LGGLENFNWRLPSDETDEMNGRPDGGLTHRCIIRAQIINKHYETWKQNYIKTVCKRLIKKTLLPKFAINPTIVCTLNHVLV